MILHQQRTGAVERLLHLARRRALRLAVAAVLGLPVPLLAQSPHPTEPTTTLLPPRPMPSPANPWDGPAAAAPTRPADPAPAVVLGAPVARAASTEVASVPQPIWRGSM